MRFANNNYAPSTVNIKSYSAKNEREKLINKLYPYVFLNNCVYILNK